MRNLLLVSFYLLLTQVLFAQKKDDNEDVKRNNPWSGFILDLGINQYKNAPGILDLKTFGSRGANVYFFFGIKLGKGKFTLAPGLGLGLDNYNFKDESLRLSTSNDSLIINTQSNGPLTPATDYKKSKLSTNYFDIPLELRFKTGKRLGKTFRIAIGGKFGILYNSHTKEKYTTLPDENTKKEKQHDDFALENFRYGLTGRVGFGCLNLFGYYSLSHLFKKGIGPDVTPFMMGITLSPSFFFEF